ncbi:MAG: replication restart helicase PriA [Thermodesulfobacteriota bacterium]
MNTLWDVALLGAPYTTLTYSLPSGFPASLWQAGLRVFVPVGRSLRPGVMLRPACFSLDAVKIKPVFWPMERVPLFPAGYLTMVEEMAKRVLQEPGAILAAALPSGLRAVKGALVSTDGKRSRTRLEELRRLETHAQLQWAELWSAGQAQWELYDAERKDRLFCCLTQDPPWRLRPGAKRQNSVLDYLWEKGLVTRERLRRELGSWAGAVVDTLCTKGLIELTPEGDSEPVQADDRSGLESLKLTVEQSEALQGLRRAADSHCAALIHGVTGSGKTLVYAHLAREWLAKGRSVLLLVPEVALARQTLRAVRHFLPEQEVYLYHGYQSPKQRETTFIDLANREEPCVIVGTRSALFLPLRDTGLIVLDEEHAESFKQDERLIYQAKELAFFRVQQSGGFLVLGSATPDLKTFAAAAENRLPKVTLNERVGASVLPDIELVNLQETPAVAGPFAATVHQQLQEVLHRGEQAIIMHNRRGYAPLVYCTGCGEVAKCPHCEVGFTFHKRRQRLVCHYCGQQKDFPFVCPKCQSSQFVPLGEGTECIEEYLSTSLPPGVRVDRLDRDSTRRQGRLEEILAAFSRGESQVLVGTQMLSKGHHFPGVTLAVVVDGDLGLNLPDYRAAERTFQMLVQVSGRAGRGEKRGQVVIQTRDPEHYCWEYVRRGDYSGFFEHEAALRQRLSYPPYVKLALLRLSFPVDWAEGAEQIREVGRFVRNAGKAAGLRVLGPAPAPLGRLRGRFRYHCLLKGENWQEMRGVYQQVRQEFAKVRQLRIQLDLDPVHMM